MNATVISAVNTTYFQVQADAEIKGTFTGPNAEKDAINLAMQITETTGSYALVWHYTHRVITFAPAA